MADRTGGELIQDFLGTYEIPYVFGNPGTTETTFLAAVADSKATYVLALHESTAVGVAAGYALITGKPSIVSLHTYPGLANGMFNMRNALMAGVPLLVINGVLSENSIRVCASNDGWRLFWQLSENRLHYARTTTTGMVLWVSTFTVSLPSTIAETPRRPWDAIKIASHPVFIAVSIMAS